ncbi:single-stranded DNA-binding protein [Dellaglioa algida]|uniref:Single-stranded DNA-binding protein n=1 Tax=Dellaglioa algida TaxID=105612 RepID=A0A5C6M5X7_9LACO|nr:single-stranded DNA-binding protein [Dellaglioa algida]MDK1720199.1 single-stranded DNA-binding protein [Dellaglioa algida]MDK1723589.1 single-stranded DNA-binding protein [Dellaglioa algida]TWW10126.1 single-stranded DNA-binding protein [Dellaglioa algida]
MNRINLVGRLTADPELKYTAAGAAVLSGTIAVPRNFKNAQGEYESDFVRYKVWRKSAEIFANYTHKGSRVAIDGRLEIGSYDDKNGNKVYTADVVVDQFDFLNSKSESTQRPATTQQTNIDPFANNGQQIDISDDNIPF